MKKYFENHLKEKLKTEDCNLDKQHDISRKKYKKQAELQYSSSKLSDTKMFFKNYNISMLTNRKILSSNINNKLQQNESIQQIDEFSNQQRWNNNMKNIQTFRERGFSLEYLKIAKKHKIKSLIELKNQGIFKKQRTKTQLSTQFPKINEFIQNQKITQQQKKILNSLDDQVRNQKNNILYQTQYHQNLKSGLNIFSNKKKKVNQFFKKFALGEQFLPINSKNLSSSIEVKSPIAFIPIQRININSTRYYFPISNDNTTQQLRQRIKTFTKKSKYSPFKSRNGSSVNHNNISDLKLINSKSFDTEQSTKSQKNTSKQIKKIKQIKHKRIQSHFQASNRLLDNNNAYLGSELSLVKNKNTTNILFFGILGHIKLLNSFKQCFSVDFFQQNLKSQTLKLTELVKTYVFGEKEIIQLSQKKYKNHMISQIDQISQIQEDKHFIRQFMCGERLLIICIVDLIAQEKIGLLLEEIRITLEVLLKIYLKIFTALSTADSDSNLTKEQAQLINALRIDFRIKQNNIQRHLKSELLSYIQNLYRYSHQIFEKQFKKQLEDSKNRTINRTFYEILKKYAIYLTNNEEKIQNYYNDVIFNFVTCPAPYILIKSLKRYTLCIDLDETLLYSKFTCSKKFQTVYRPGAKEFIIQLSKYFEIIIFTSSVQEYADEVIKPFMQFVDYVLYRYHVTRGKNMSNAIKDLSRIGRKLQKIVFIDDLECNAKLQPENSIHVKPWKGALKDTEIINLKKHLLALGKQEQERDDLRKEIGQIKEKLKFC